MEDEKTAVYAQVSAMLALCDKRMLELLRALIRGMLAGKHKGKPE